MSRPLKEAQEMNAIAESAQHSLLWRETPKGYSAFCQHCNIVITVENDGSSTFTIEKPLPVCKQLR